MSWRGAPPFAPAPAVGGSSRGSAASRLRAAWLVSAGLVGAGLVVGCDLPPEREEAGPVVLGTDPADGDVDVDRRADLRVFFDRPVHPRDVRRGRVAVRSGARAAFVSAWFEPVERVLVVENLSAQLEPRVTYRLVVADVRDLDRAPMEERYEAAFVTAELPGTAAPTPLAGWDDVAPLLARCASDGCHGGREPVLGLDLSSPDAIERTAIGVPAEQSRVGTQDGEVWPGASTLAGLARIDVVAGRGRPSRSYLVYKLIGDPHVSGQVMPPPSEPPLTESERRLISLWIRAGAPTL